ncbi:hypothetical protein M2189_008585 [Bradyrhizobium japonicum]|nr:hypothetical protein [Bradyrhizobium japonicum]MCS3965382.1 hypothetical protein [Bradyrhizobium japonicum]MCS3997689.1 hypothetical protein [Bradyrhizobium japonicum]
MPSQRLTTCSPITFGYLINSMSIIKKPKSDGSISQSNLALMNSR